MRLTLATLLISAAMLPAVAQTVPAEETGTETVIPAQPETTGDTQPAAQAATEPAAPAEMPAEPTATAQGDAQPDAGAEEHGVAPELAVTTGEPTPDADAAQTAAPATVRALTPSGALAPTETWQPPLATGLDLKGPVSG